MHGVRRFCGHTLRKATKPVPASHAIAGTEALNATAAGDHSTGGVCSRHVWESWQHLLASSDHQVRHGADGGSRHIDQDLVAPGVRFGRFTDAQSLDPVETV